MIRMFAAAAAALLVLGGCQNQQGNAQWTEFQSQFVEGYFEQNPVYAAYQGRHEFDGRLPNWTEEGIAAQIAFLTNAISEAEALQGLNPQQTFERDYLVATARGELFWLQTADQPHTNPSFYMDSLSPSVYVTRPYAAADVRLRAYIRYLEAIPTAAQHIRANLRAPLPRVFIDYGRAAFGGLAEYYQGDGKAAFASVEDAALQTQLSTASNAAAVAMTGLSNWLETQRATATDNFALGAERFSQMLRDTEMVNISLAELERVGREDLQRNQAALRTACAEYAPGATIPECVTRVNATKPAGGAVAGARAQLAGLRQLIVDHNLVSIPGTEEAQVEEAPPFARQNFAYIDIPGPYETGLPSVFTLPRLIRRGRHRCRPISCRVRRNCCLSPRTKYGLATFSTFFTRTARRSSSAACSSVTLTPRAGRITRKR